MNSTLLITGGSGSFGSAFVKSQSDKFKKIIIFSRDWIKQKKLAEDLKDKQNIRYLIGDIRDLERLKLATRDVDIILHSAAIKDIDVCEFNCLECLKTNILGSQNVIESAIFNKVSQTILISTDKAVNALNSYGISKAYAEKLFINANKLSGTDKIQFKVTRWGNVSFSNGSVIPKFLELKSKLIFQLPLTHLKATRFWINMDDAIKLVLKSMYSNEKILIPKMKSFRIIDLIRALNCKPIIVGLRTGEKIHEEIEQGVTSEHNEFMTIDEIREEIEKWKKSL